MLLRSRTSCCPRPATSCGQRAGWLDTEGLQRTGRGKNRWACPPRKHTVRRSGPPVFPPPEQSRAAARWGAAQNPTLLRNDLRAPRATPVRLVPDAPPKPLSQRAMARIDVIMPQMGESIAEGTLSKWLKKAGDTVKRDEPIFEISTDKVDAEIPAPAAGTLAEIKVQEGQTDRKSVV